MLVRGSYHFDTMVETITCFYRRMIVPGFLRHCEMDFVHPQ